MTQNDYNLLASSQYNATYEDLTQINQQKSLAEEKAKRLAERTQQKLNRIDDYAPDVLIGMSDAVYLTQRVTPESLIDVLSDVKYHSANVYHMRQKRRQSIEFRIDRVSDHPGRSSRSCHSRCARCIGYH